MATKKLLSENVVIDLQDFVKNPQGFVLLVGQNGRGKSYAALKIYSQLAHFRLPHYDHDQAWFINQAEMNIKFADMNESGGSAMVLLKQACKSKLLILDDLGTRPPSPAFMDFLYAIIDNRWNNRFDKATIITTNLDSTRIRKDFGDAIFSRITSGRNYIVIGEDRRFTDLGF